MLITKREVPYACAVVVEEFEKRKRNNSEDILYYSGYNICRKTDTKSKIIIGKGGNIVKTSW